MANPTHTFPPNNLVSGMHRAESAFEDPGFAFATEDLQIFRDLSTSNIIKMQFIYLIRFTRHRG